MMAIGSEVIGEVIGKVIGTCAVGIRVEIVLRMIEIVAVVP